MHRRNGLVAIAIGSTMALAAVVPAAAQAPGSIVVSRAELKWKDMGIPGVSAAPVEGDMAKGSSHFYLKYPAGFVTPPHHHTADHWVTTVAGNLILTVDGKEHKLPPGSFFALTGKASHVARCEGKEDCIMFLQAAGPWDVVPETMK